MHRGMKLYDAIFDPVPAANDKLWLIAVPAAAVVIVVAVILLILQKRRKGGKKGSRPADK